MQSNATACRTAYHLVGPAVTGTDRRSRIRKFKTQVILTMKFIAILLLATFLSASARSGAQTVSLNKKDAPLQAILKEVEFQTGFQFFYKAGIEPKFRLVSVQFTNLPLNQALEKIFENQVVKYRVVERTITLIDDREEFPFLPPELINVSGVVIDEMGNPVFATITLKGTSKKTTTNERGEFIMKEVTEGSMLVISAINIETYEVQVAGNPNLGTIQVKPKVGKLDETLVIGYGSTSRRYSTGTVTKVTKEDIERQPVGNLLAALEGRVAGLTVVQSSGLPGASIKIQLRGQNSITQGSEPFFIIDGVPFAPNNSSVNRLFSSLTSNGGGLSPFSFINPSDIESIEILKDADATSIYGSRGANGVILITTKKSKLGKTRLSVDVNSRFSKVTRLPAMLGTSDYLRMRREAFANDNITPSILNAPDLLVWDTTRFTSFPKLLIGGTSNSTIANIGLQGGNEFTSFMINSTYSDESTVLPGDLRNQKISFTSFLSHKTPNRKAQIDLSATYLNDVNRLTAAGLGNSINLPPNAPELYNSDGTLNWQQGGQSFENPLAYLKKPYKSIGENLLANLQLTYRLLPGLTVKSSIGYNTIRVDETLIEPIAAQNPDFSPTGTYSVGSTKMHSIIFEPQASYTKVSAIGNWEALVGASYQQTENSGTTMLASGYTNDALIKSLSGAGSTYQYNDLSQYKYAAIFTRLGYTLRSKYLVNLNFRRDGSSRFGPKKRFSSFGSIASAWIFSSETAIRKSLPFLSFGKLRFSYGTTGNDQIGDYKYLDTWSVGQPYQGSTSLYPSSLFNPNYSWETIRKIEAGIQLGFFNDKLLLNATWFRNRSSNQLIENLLPSQTGFFSVIDNFDAVVENSGLEFDFNSTQVSNKKITWSTTFNLTLPKNKLVSFPGIETSAYNAKYRIGEPLNLVYAFQSQGVNPNNGLFMFDDIDRNGAIQAPNDYKVSGHLAPVFFGGFGNTLKYQKIEIHVFLSFKKQDAPNYLSSLYSQNIIPGMMFNQPTYVLNRWTKPGDISDMQRFTASTASAAYGNVLRFRSSDGIYGDASYLRLRTIDISYAVDNDRPAKMFKSIKFFLQVQNLITLTRYKGADPETHDLFSVPPMKTWSIGIKSFF